MVKSLIVTLAAVSLLSPLAQADTASPKQPAQSYRPQGSSLQTITPIFSQLLVTSLPQGFQTVFEDANGTHYIRESVLTGENEQSWTQMITVTGVKGLAANPGMTPKKFAENMAGRYQSACPASYRGGCLREGTIGGYDGYVAILSCGTSPTTAGQTSESALVAVIKGEKDYYTVQWAERSAPSDFPLAVDTRSWEERLQRLSPLRLCPRVPGEAAPFPSCLGS